MTEDPLETESERLRRDKEKLEGDLHRYDQARERQRQTLRQRELEREEERERDKEEFRDRERRRSAQTVQDRRTFAPRSSATVTRSAGPGPGLVLQDLSRLAYAWVRTGIEAATGINQAVGNLAVDLTDSLWGRHAKTSTAGTRETFSSRSRYAYSDSYDYGARGFRASSVRIDDRSRDAPTLVSDISIGLSNAVRQTAEVFARSAENFSKVFEEETLEDDVPNEFNEPPPPPPASSLRANDDELFVNERSKPITDKPIT